MPKNAVNSDKTLYANISKAKFKLLKIEQNLQAKLIIIVIAPIINNYEIL